MGFYTTEFYENQQTGSVKSARAVVPYVTELVAPQSVIDVGCGVGTWLSVFSKQGVADHLGIDGAYVNKDLLLIDGDRFLERNLESPLDIDRQFDLAVSLEVAEHLKETSASAFVESLTRLAPVILFSAAIPAQTGEGHINEQWPDYWKTKFDQVGYRSVDCLRGRFWHDEDVQPWYKQNMMLFVRQDRIGDYPNLAPWLQKEHATPLSIVHPDYYMARTKMAFDRPWAALYRYYRELIVEAIKKCLPDRYVVTLKELRYRWLR